MKKNKKRGALKQQPIALCLWCLLPYLCSLLPFILVPSFVYHKFITGTRIGQQLGQVLWTFIQYCYLLLTCVPHTYIYLFVCLPRSTYYFRLVHPEDLAILVPLPHRYHEPAIGCTIYCCVGKNLVRAW